MTQGSYRNDAAVRLHESSRYQPGGQIDPVVGVAYRRNMMKLYGVAVIVAALIGCGRSNSQCDAFADKVMKCDDGEKTPEENDELSRKLLVGMCRQAPDKLAAELACMNEAACPAFNACMDEVQKAAIKAAIERSNAGKK